MPVSVIAARDDRRRSGRRIRIALGDGANHPAHLVGVSGALVLLRDARAARVHRGHVQPIVIGSGKAEATRVGHRLQQPLVRSAAIVGVGKMARHGAAGPIQLLAGLAPGGIEHRPGGQAAGHLPQQRGPIAIRIGKRRDGGIRRRARRAIAPRFEITQKKQQNRAQPDESGGVSEGATTGIHGAIFTPRSVTLQARSFDGPERPASMRISLQPGHGTCQAQPAVLAVWLLSAASSRCAPYVA